MGEAVSLRLIDNKDILRVAGKLSLPILLAALVLTGLPYFSPVDIQAASARTVERAKIRAPVARRKTAGRSKRLRARRPSRVRKTIVRAPAAPKKTAATKFPGNKTAVKQYPTQPTTVKQDSTKKTAVKQAPFEVQPVQLDKGVIMAKIYSLRDRGLNEHLAGNHGWAVRRLLEATQLSSTYHGKPSATETLLFLDLATCAEQAGLSSVALQAYAQWLDRAPRSSEARIRLSGLLARQGQVREATRVARKAIEFDPPSPRAHLLLALLLEHQGELSEARMERESSRALLESRPQTRKPEPEIKTTDVETGDFTPSGPENFDEIPLGLQ